MSLRGGEIVRWPVGDGWVQGVLTGSDSARAALLVLPPFFHEWQRGYRHFAVLADALAGLGVAGLRFDYRGTGESSGEDAQFLPSRALEDAHSAFLFLQSRCPAPVTLLGIRAGALLAERAAERVGRPWWSWQPVDDGRSHYEALRQRDTFERNNRLRFPYRSLRAAPRDDQLMGHRLHPEFALELGIFKRTSSPGLRIDHPDALPGDGLALPASLLDWAAQVDLQGRVPVNDLAATAERMAHRLLAAEGAVA